MTMTEALPEWWLSFVGDDDVFRGVCIVDAPDPDSAIRRAWDLGINPGGEVMLLAMLPGQDAHLPRRVLLGEKQLDGTAIQIKDAPQEVQDALAASRGLS